MYLPYFLNLSVKLVQCTLNIYVCNPQIAIKLDKRSKDQCCIDNNQCGEIDQRGGKRKKIRHNARVCLHHK